MEPKQFWNKIAGKYDRQALGKYQNAYAETIAISKKYLNKSDRVLDFACGTGITTIEIAPVVRQVIAIDLSEEMIRLAREKAASNGIDNASFYVSSLKDADLADHSFDVITAFNILHGLDNPESVLSHIWRLLKPGGFFLSVTDCLGEKTTMTSILHIVLHKLGIIPKVNFFKRDDLITLISKGFAVVEEKNLYPVPPNYYIAAVKRDA